MTKKAFLHARVDIPLLFISVVVYFRCCLCNIYENDFFASAKKFCLSLHTFALQT